MKTCSRSRGAPRRWSPNASALQTSCSRRARSRISRSTATHSTRGCASIRCGAKPIWSRSRQRPPCCARPSRSSPTRRSTSSCRTAYSTSCGRMTRRSYFGRGGHGEDDEGDVSRRGVGGAVCEKALGIYGREPYRAQVDLVEPRELVPLDEAPAFPCAGGPSRRDPRETKGEGYRATTEACKPGSCC